MVVTWAMEIDTDPCCCMTKDTDMVLSSKVSKDFTMVSSGPQTTHISLFLPTFVSSDSPPFIVINLFCFSFSPISLPHTHTL